MSFAGEKSGPTGSKQHDYFGSIAGIVCQGPLDFIWGLLLDGKLVWPTTIIVDANEPFPEHEFPEDTIIAFDGRIWRATTDTTHAPPHADWELFRVNLAAAPNPYKFTVENWGEAFLYRGTGSQTLDTVEEKMLNDNGHPAYRHRAVLVLKDFLFGTERQSAPNAVLLGGRAPVQTLITGDATALDADWQANPWCILAELLTHPVIGLGLPNTCFDATSWQAQADWCRENSHTTYISPFYDRQKQIRHIVAELMEYMDGFVYWTTAGTIAAGHWPHGDAPPVFTDANSLDIHDLVEPINWKAQTWRDTTNATVVNYRDIHYAFQNVPAKASNLFNRAATRRVQSRSLDRPFIVRAAQATAVAGEDAKLNGEPGFGGELVVRAEKVAGIGIGDIFLLTDESQQLNRGCRCTGRTLSAPPTGTVKLSYETERGLAELPYTGVPLNPTPADPPAPARITHFELVQLPPQLSPSGDDYQFACLTARNHGLTTGLGVWWQNEDADAFERLIRQTGFAVFGTLSGSINTADVSNELLTDDSVQGNTYQLGGEETPRKDAWGVVVEYSATGSAPWTAATEGDDYLLDGHTGTVTINENGAIAGASHVRASYAYNLNVELAAETPLSDIERISTSLTDDEIANHTLLLFLFKDSDPKTFEILSVKSVSAAGGGVYTLAVKRALYGTREGGDGTYVFTTGDRAFLIFRSGLSTFTHEEFATVAAAEGTATFRLAPATAWSEAEVADVYDTGENPAGLTTETNYSFLDPYPPIVTWTGIFANTGEDGAWEVVTDLNTMFDTATRFRITASVTDRNADIISYSVNYYRGGNVATLISQDTVSPSAALSRTFEFTLTEIGAYRIVFSARDRTARVTDQFLTSVGGTSEKFILVQSGSPEKTQPPTVTVVNGKKVTLACATPGATIRYQVKIVSDIPPTLGGGGWNTYVGGVGFNSGNKTLYAYAEASPLSPSDIVVHN